MWAFPTSVVKLHVGSTDYYDKMFAMGSKQNLGIYVLYLILASCQRYSHVNGLYGVIIVPSGRLRRQVAGKQVVFHVECSQCASEISAPLELIPHVITLGWFHH